MRRSPAASPSGMYMREDRLLGGRERSSGSCRPWGSRSSWAWLEAPLSPVCHTSVGPPISQSALGNGRRTVLAPGPGPPRERLQYAWRLEAQREGSGALWNLSLKHLMQVYTVLLPQLITASKAQDPHILQRGAFGVLRTEAVPLSHRSLQPRSGHVLESHFPCGGLKVEPQTAEMGGGI